jgi:hypothetical protein
MALLVVVLRVLILPNGPPHVSFLGGGRSPACRERMSCLGVAKGEWLEPPVSADTARRPQTRPAVSRAVEGIEKRRIRLREDRRTVLRDQGGDSARGRSGCGVGTMKSRQLQDYVR